MEAIGLKVIIYKPANDNEIKKTVSVIHSERIIKNIKESNLIASDKEILIDKIVSAFS